MVQDQYRRSMRGRGCWNERVEMCCRCSLRNTDLTHKLCTGANVIPCKCHNQLSNTHIQWGCWVYGLIIIFVNINWSTNVSRACSKLEPQQRYCWVMQPHFLAKPTDVGNSPHSVLSVISIWRPEQLICTWSCSCLNQKEAIIQREAHIMMPCVQWLQGQKELLCTS